MLILFDHVTRAAIPTGRLTTVLVLWLLLFESRSPGYLLGPYI